MKKKSLNLGVFLACSWGILTLAFSSFYTQEVATVTIIIAYAPLVFLTVYNNSD